jgi:flavin reductase (DIM6/NTAB) family NADH-FMN oxidoreductase RutF
VTDEVPTDVFDEISEMSSNAIFKPKVPSLVVSNSESMGPNVMTAMWYMVAGYDPFRWMLAVRHVDHTHEIIEENPEFVLAAPSTEMVDALTLSGMVSHRDLDKVEHLGLETVPGAEVDVPVLANAVGNIECSVMDSFEFENCTYYFGSVEKAYVRPDGMDGRLPSLDQDVLAYLGSDWEDGDEHTKSRYWAELDPSDVRRFRGDEVVESLPADLREEYED